MIIKNITAKKIIASMGDYTVQATIEFVDGSKSTASVPAGISAGKYEIKKVSADEAVGEIGKIAGMISGKDWTQETLDREVSSHGFGGNSTLAVSAAFYKGDSGRASPLGKLGTPLARMTGSLPKIMLLLFEGGEHGNKNISIQEFLMIEDTLEQAMRDFKTVKEHLVESNIEHTVGAEGGFSPQKFGNDDVLSLLKNVLPDRKIGLDVADSFSNGEFLDYSYMTHTYPIFSLEDPYDDESWEKWTNLTNMIGKDLLVIADDLTTTNPERIKKALDQKACNAVVIKPNQIGTISAAIEAVKVARDGGLKIVVSHRGQETVDTWIVDFAVDVMADFVKFGGMNRGERIAKYNRLLELLPSGPQG